MFLCLLVFPLFFPLSHSLSLLRALLLGLGFGLVVAYIWLQLASVGLPFGVIEESFSVFWKN